MTPPRPEQPRTAAVAASMRQQVQIARAQGPAKEGISARWLNTLADWATILEREAAAPFSVAELAAALDRLFEQRWERVPHPGKTTINLEDAAAILAEIERGRG